MKKLTITGILIIFALAFTGCTSKKEDNTMKDGCYTAQMQEYSYGWKEYVTITVKNGKIVSTEFDAENASGFIKSWDSNYMQNMLKAQGTYPNEYTRYYASQLQNGQGKNTIDVLTGATSSYYSFQKLSVAVIEQARRGDSSIVIVDAS